MQPRAKSEGPGPAEEPAGAAMKTGRPSKPGGLGVGLLLLAASLLVAAGLAEVGLRIFCRESLGISRDERTLLYRYDSVLGWRPAPDSSNQFLGTRLITAVNNTLGFRDAEPVTNSHPGLMFLGDSFVWGYDVEAPERFTDKLRARHPEWNIYNLGVSGYGTDQEFLLLQMEFERYRPRLVFVVYSTETDEGDNRMNFRYEGYYKPYCLVVSNRLEIAGIPVPKSERVFVAEHRRLASFYVARLVVRAWFKLTSPLVLVNPGSPTGPLFLNLQQYARSQGATLAVGLTLPRPSLREFLERHDIPVLDLTTLLRYPGNGFHWTPEGHTFVCDRIDEFLTKTKFAAAPGPPPAPARKP